MSDLLQRVTLIAVDAHRDQTDKAGKPYIFHVMRVALSLSSEVDRMAALLHDVVEDTEWTLDRLREADLPPWLLEAVNALTRREGEPYDEYIRRLSTNGIARAVKRADIADNLRPERITMLDAPEAARLSKRYHAAFRRLA